MKPRYFICLVLLNFLIVTSSLAGKSGVIVRISDFQRDNLQRLRSIKEITESPQITLDLSISNITYLSSSPSQIEGYQINIRILNVSARNYPPESYQISNIKYSPIGRISSFEYFGKTPMKCVATGTHHLVAPISKKNSDSPPMLALSTPAKGAMNTLFGMDFQNVTVKTDTIKRKFALEIQNEVYALGKDIYFSHNGEFKITLPFNCTPSQNQPM